MEILDQLILESATAQDPDLCARSAEAISWLASGGEVATGEHGDRDGMIPFKEQVAGVFSSPGFPSAEVMRRLIDILKTKKLGHPVSVAASCLVVCVGPGGRDAIPDLINMLKTKKANGHVSQLAAQALASMGEVAASAADTLLHQLYKWGPDHSPNHYAVALAAVGGDDESLIERLVADIADSSSPTWRATADAIGECGFRVAEAVPALVAACRSSDSDVRMAAADALGNVAVGREHVVDVLLSLAHDEASWVRAHAILALGRLGMSADRILPTIIEALDDDEGPGDYTVSEFAIVALGELGPAAEEAVPRLLKCLDDVRNQVHEGLDPTDLIKALAAIGPVAGPAVSKLKHLMSDEDIEDIFGDQIKKAIDRIAGSPGSDETLA